MPRPVGWFLPCHPRYTAGMPISSPKPHRQVTGTLMMPRISDHNAFGLSRRTEPGTEPGSGAPYGEDPSGGGESLLIDRSLPGGRSGHLGR